MHQDVFFTDPHPPTGLDQAESAISQLAGKVAYYAGVKSLRPIPALATLTRPAALIGAAGASAALTIWLIRRRRKQNGGRDLASSQTYIEQGFDMEAGQVLTDEFGGAGLSEPALRAALGSGSASKPVLKLGGEDDLFLGEGPNGHLYYSLPEDGTAQIAAVVPRQGRDHALGQTLAEATPKYVISGYGSCFRITVMGKTFSLNFAP